MKNRRRRRKYCVQIIGMAQRLGRELAPPGSTPRPVLAASWVDSRIALMVSQRTGGIHPGRVARMHAT